MHNYRLASHNTFTYLKPTKWWMNLFSFASKCQEKDAITQYEKGCEMFDLRVRFKKNGQPIAVHGVCEYKWENVADFLEYLNKHNKRLFVRILLEFNREPKDIDYQTKQFVSLCDKLQKDYPGIIFFGGRRKWDWKFAYTFNTKEPRIEEYHASVFYKRKKWYYLPKYQLHEFARTHNRAKIIDGTNEDYLMLDFI